MEVIRPVRRGCSRQSVEDQVPDAGASAPVDQVDIEADTTTMNPGEQGRLSAAGTAMIVISAWNRCQAGPMRDCLMPGGISCLQFYHISQAKQ